MKILLTLLLVLSLNQYLKAQIIDVTAATRYFELVDSLKAGKPLSPETWQAFLQLEGKKLYIQIQAFSAKYLENYRKNMEIVYMPQHDSTLQRRLSDWQKNFDTYVIHQYKAKEPEIRAYLANLDTGKEAYIDKMYENSYSMLPKRLQKKSPDTKMFFIGIHNDALVQDGNIVFTLWTSYNYDKAKYGALGGHELHHVLRSPKHYNVKEKDQGLLLLLNLLLNEGSPDLIDKKISLTPDFPQEMQYGEYFLTTGQKSLPMIDAALTEMALGKKEYAIKDVKKLVGSSGHIPGFYMAEIIERNGLRSKLVKHVDDPFQFIYLYNMAAKKDKAKPHVFSEQVMAYLKKVESDSKGKR